MSYALAEREADTTTNWCGLRLKTSRLVSFRRKHAFSNKRSASLNVFLVVDLKDVDRGAADGRAPNEDRTVPSEVPRPLVPSRIEKPSLLAGFRIDAAEVRSFMEIAVEAGPT